MGEWQTRAQVSTLLLPKPARIDHDQLRALAQAALHLACEHRMGIGGIGADDEDHVGIHHRIEILRAGRGAEGRLQAIAGG